VVVFAAFEPEEVNGLIQSACLAKTHEARWYRGELLVRALVRRFFVAADRRY